MPVIHVIPVTQGMSEQELAGRLQSGWIHAGRQAVNVGQGIVDPSKPMTPTGIVDCDVWVLPEPMMPALALARALLHLADDGGDLVTLERLAEGVLGQSLNQLREMTAAVMQGGPHGRQQGNAHPEG